MVLTILLCILLFAAIIAGFLLRSSSARNIGLFRLVLILTVGFSLLASIAPQENKNLILMLLLAILIGVLLYDATRPIKKPLTRK